MYATSIEESPFDGPMQDACLVCGERAWVPHFGGRDPLPGGAPRKAYRITHSERKLRHAIQRCTGCGLIVLPPARGGVESYEEGADPQYVEHAAERVRNAHALLALLPTGGRLLDVGCACGFLLVAARARGFEVEGIEPSGWAAEYARREQGLNVLRGRLDTVDLAPDSYDAVVLADTIEHLTDPRDAVRRIHRILKKGGRVLILTPDIGSWTARVAGARWWGLLDDHYFYFSRRTLARLLAEEGFLVERCMAFGRAFPLEHWVYKLSQYSTTVHRIASRVCRGLAIDRVNLWINLGDQMVCVARKK